MNIIKDNLMKIIVSVFIISFLSWGVSSIAEDDISSAHDNFSVVGIISDINDNNIIIEQANGSDSKSKTSYVLNIKNLEKIETNKYQILSMENIKIGDKIIAQGLTNGSTFFIKRLISFADIDVSDDLKDNATTTLDNVSVDENSTTTDVSTSDIEESTVSLTDISTSTDNFASTTSTTSDIVPTTISTTSSTTTDNSSEDDSVLDRVVDVIQEVVEVITESVSDILDNNSTTTESTI